MKVILLSFLLILVSCGVDGSGYTSCVSQALAKNKSQYEPKLSFEQIEQFCKGPK